MISGARAAKIGVFLLLGAASQAAEDLRPAAGLAMPLYNSGESARAKAMGSAFAGVADDSTALFWNVAGLGTLKNTEIGLHHHSGLLGALQENLVLGLPSGSWGGIGASFHYVDFGRAEGRDAGGNPTASYAIRDAGFSLGWGRELHRGLYGGLGLKGMQQNVGEEVYSSVAGDLGLIWLPLESLRLGVALANFGGGSSGRPQASAIRAGASWRVGGLSNNQTLLAAGVQTEPSGMNRIQVGVEQIYRSWFALRGGYQLSLEDSKLGAMAGLSAGLGLRVRTMALDYSYQPFGELGTTQRVSLTYRFEQPVLQKPLDAQGAQDEIDRQLAAQAATESLKFGKRASVMSGEAEIFLTQLADLLRRHPEMRLAIEGHADIEGGDEFNHRLSQQRADTAMRFLLEHGVPSVSIVSSKGLGSSQPQADNATEEGRAKNRRVVFRFK